MIIDISDRNCSQLRSRIIVLLLDYSDDKLTSHFI